MDTDPAVNVSDRDADQHTETPADDGDVELIEEISIDGMCGVY